MLHLADVLAMPVVRSADPQVLAAGDRLARRVRWVHTTELSDIGPLLRGGDLVLTTGIALPDDPGALSGFAESLSASDAAGLLVELGRRWTALPDSLVAACERLGLPLVALRREVRFAAVAQAVGERLVDEQLAELREVHRVHEVFTELSISEAGPEEVLAAVQRLAGAGVVLESSDHHVLDYRAGPEGPGPFLDDWERRSRRVQPAERTAWDESNGWLVTLVGRPERRWGRLVIGAATPPSQRLVAVAERAAAALALHRLHDRTRDSHVRRVHHELVLGLLAHPSDPDLPRRCELAGLPATSGCYAGLALRPVAGRTPPGQVAAHLDDLVAAVLRAGDAVGARLLVAAFDGEVRALVAVPQRTDPVALVDRLVASARGAGAALAAGGTPVSHLAAADRTLREALHVLAALPESADGTSVHRLEDVHVRGLLVLLADDDRVRAFSDRELAPLREADRRDGTDLLGLVRVVLEHWGSKSAAAARLTVSRPVLYDRIARLERLLEVDLRDPEVRTSLHLALLAAEMSTRSDAARRA